MGKASKDQSVVHMTSRTLKNAVMTLRWWCRIIVSRHGISPMLAGILLIRRHADLGCTMPTLVQPRTPEVDGPPSEAHTRQNFLPSNLGNFAPRKRAAYKLYYTTARFLIVQLFLNGSKKHSLASTSYVSAGETAPTTCCHGSLSNNSCRRFPPLAV